MVDSNRSITDASIGNPKGGPLNRQETRKNRFAPEKSARMGLPVTKHAKAEPSLAFPAFACAASVGAFLAVARNR
jgi:hypothetical protein